MNIRTALLAIAGTAMLSSAALAATGNTNHPANRPEMADRCSTLESQYSNAVTRELNASKFDQAEALGSMGTSECNANQGDIGVHKLEQALLDLGVKPAA